MKNIKYNLYATLLDSYQDYLRSGNIYYKYWGNADIPPMTEDEFHEKKRLELIDRINRVPFDNENADRGTAFNEIVDCIIHAKKSDKMQISSDKTIGTITAIFNNRTFVFPIPICMEFADYYKGAVSQVYTEAILPTIYGNVKLYGYMDELMPMCVHDIKTTTNYYAFKFKDHWQHTAYLYCLNATGNDIFDFEYNILCINEKRKEIEYETFTEQYSYHPEMDVPYLKAHVESLIDFIEIHKDEITDKKIFNKHELQQ